MTETRSFDSAPKDGTAINVQFPDGTTAKARWNVEGSRWQVIGSTGTWRDMRYAHGVRDPAVWWPE